MSHHNAISTIFKGQVSLGAQVTVKGWLRSKRDSKAGISFLAVHDGCAGPGEFKGLGLQAPLETVHL